MRKVVSQNRPSIISSRVIKGRLGSSFECWLGALEQTLLTLPLQTLLVSFPTTLSPQAHKSRVVPQHTLGSQQQMKSKRCSHPPQHSHGNGAVYTSQQDTRPATLVNH